MAWLFLFLLALVSPAWGGEPELFGKTHYDVLGLDREEEITPQSLAAAVEKAARKAKVEISAPSEYQIIVKKIMAAEEALKDSESRQRYDKSLEASEAISPELEAVIQKLKDSSELSAQEISRLEKKGGRDNVAYLKRLVGLLSLPDRISNNATNLLKGLAPSSEEFSLWLVDRVISRRPVNLRLTYLDILERMPVSGKTLERMVELAFTHPEEPRIEDAMTEVLGQRLVTTNLRGPANRRALARLAGYFGQQPVVVSHLFSLIDFSNVDAALFEHALRSIPFEQMSGIDGSRVAAYLSATALMLRIMPEAAGALLSHPDTPTARDFTRRLERVLQEQLNVAALKAIQAARDRSDFDFEAFFRRCK